jgi:hypothetical protein
MKLKIHDCNLQTIWDCLNSGYPEVWLHGSGDIFPVYTFNPLEPEKQDHSKNHAEQFNRGHEENSYRVKISKANMPKTVEQAKTMLMQSKMQEEAAKESSVHQTSGRVTNIRQSETDFRADVHEPAGEIDYSKFNKANA